MKSTIIIIYYNLIKKEKYKKNYLLQSYKETIPTYTPWLCEVTSSNILEVQKAVIICYLLRNIM